MLLESEDAAVWRIGSRLDVCQGQSEYESLVKNSNEKKMADSRSLGSKQAAKAELEGKLQRSQGLKGITLRSSEVEES